MSVPIRCFRLLALALLVAGCGENFVFGQASIENVEDEFTIFATNGTPIGLPNAYALLQNRLAVSFGLPQNRTIRTDLSADFDFVFDIDPTETPTLTPTALFGLGSFSAHKATDLTFEELGEAPLEDYITQEAATLAVGDVLVLRSRPLFCLGLALFVYAKVELLELDLTDRSARFRILYNPSCGFRGLEPGLPSS